MQAQWSNWAPIDTPKKLQIMGYKIAQKQNKCCDHTHYQKRSPIKLTTFRMQTLIFTTDQILHILILFLIEIVLLSMHQLRDC